jgi:cell division protease FtsH
MQLPINEKYKKSKSSCMNDIAILLGGRGAEEIVLNEKFSGASDDIRRATETARRMVCEWGMSDKMGPLVYGKKEEQIFLGREIARHQDYSEATAVSIDEEVHRIVMEQLELVRKLLNEHIDTLHNLAQALLDREVLDGNEVDDIVNGNIVVSA